LSLDLTPPLITVAFMRPTAGVRIAMWSGPRNISTALMRAWGNRPDTFVTDEPLYAHYLKVTLLQHPGADEVIAHHESDWRKVVARITGEIPEGKKIWYQKHMAHHLLPEIELGWIDRVVNCFLIREPTEMLASLMEFVPQPTLRDTGLPQQVRIFEMVRERTGRVPPVLDAEDVLRDPRGVLTKLCDAVGVPFTEAMLRWPAGRRKTDGIWAKNWYSKVEQTTGFQPLKPKNISLPEQVRDLVEPCQQLYQTLREHRL